MTVYSDDDLEELAFLLFTVDDSEAERIQQGLTDRQMDIVVMLMDRITERLYGDQK